MKITRVKFYQNIDMGGQLPISFAMSESVNVNVKAYKLSVIEGLGVKVEGEFKTVIVPFNNVAQIDVAQEVAEKEVAKSNKKGA